LTCVKAAQEAGGVRATSAPALQVEPHLFWVVRSNVSGHGELKHAVGS